MMIPLFDALAHPTLTGKWIDQHNRDASFTTLIHDLKAANFIGACAVGLDTVENYQHETFLKACQPYELLHPIAGFKPCSPTQIKQEISQLKERGYHGIKLHPRLSKLSLNHPLVHETFKQAEHISMPVFLCSYHHTHVLHYQTTDPFYELINCLKQAPKVKLLIVHGGGTEVLRYAELARFNDNILLDLSLTMMKYENSSVDNDIRFLFQRFDRKICIGSDHPEHAHQMLRQRFTSFAEGITDDQAHNIGHRNITQFLKLF